MANELGRKRKWLPSNRPSFRKAVYLSERKQSRISKQSRYKKWRNATFIKLASNSNLNKLLILILLWRYDLVQFLEIRCLFWNPAYFLFVYVRKDKRLFGKMGGLTVYKILQHKSNTPAWIIYNFRPWWCCHLELCKFHFWYSLERVCAYPVTSRTARLSNFVELNWTTKFRLNSLIELFKSR